MARVFGVFDRPLWPLPFLLPACVCFMLAFPGGGFKGCGGWQRRIGA